MPLLLKAFGAFQHHYEKQVHFKLCCTELPVYSGGDPFPFNDYFQSNNTKYS